MGGTLNVKRTAFDILLKAALKYKKKINKAHIPLFWV